ncbi:MAG: glycosyltransferase family 39 protein, partial [Acidobacteria bacterium]|nr:glycosyltransferase family 39 protein [Acidobacteriota bacterium]
ANPPHFAFSFDSGPGKYRGFFWFYFFNEHLLRFLNLRYPRDYNTVPRLWFWLLNLVWLFPWSAYLVDAPGLSYRVDDRVGRVRRMTLCWAGVVMVFFTFSTTQEYYSMPMYPALALLIGSSLAQGSFRLEKANRLLLWFFSLVSAAIFLLVACMARSHPNPTGDISRALTQHPELYTLSLGHLRDLSWAAFAYLQLPLLLAGTACGICAFAAGLWQRNRLRSVGALATGMILFFQAARVALVRFDPYLSSYRLAEALEKAPPGDLIEANAYYAFSSVFFYSHRRALLLNGRKDNLEYGSYSPTAPPVFIDDREFSNLWQGPTRWYLLAYGSELPHIRQLLGSAKLYTVSSSAANYLLTNWPLPK